MTKKYDLVFLPTFKRDYKKYRRKHIRLKDLSKVFTLLMDHNTKILKSRYKDHPLRGNNKGCRELHLAPNILIKYHPRKRVMVLVMIKLGSHQHVLK